MKEMRMLKELDWSLKKPFPTKGQKTLLFDHCTNTLNKQNFELYLRVMTRFKDITSIIFCYPGNLNVFLFLDILKAYFVIHDIPFIQV